MSATLRQVSVTTSWAALPAIRAGQVHCINLTGADLEIRYAGDTSAGHLVAIPDKGFVALPVVNQSSELQIKAAAGAAGVNLVIL